MKRRNPGEAVFSMKGEWRTQVLNAAGEVVEDSGWKLNQVQNTNATMLATLLHNVVGYSGILYFAYGSGQSSWDSTPPTQAYSDTTLTTEVFRKAIDPSELTFRNPTTFASIEPTRSNVVQIDQVLGTTEANGFALREFGVFGGDADGTTDSGDMMNWVVHGRIDKDNTISVVRSVRFTFQVL